MRNYRFWSDTNQRLFEDRLEQAGVPYERTDHYQVTVLDPPDWLEAVAQDLGADCS